MQIQYCVSVINDEGFYTNVLVTKDEIKFKKKYQELVDEGYRLMNTVVYKNDSIERIVYKFGY